MTSSYLLRPLRTLEQARKDINRPREEAAQTWLAEICERHHTIIIEDNENGSV